MYNPGVTNISGQLLAQGMERGMDNFMRGMKQRELKREQDKQFLAQAKATESYIKANPTLFGGEEKIADLLAVDPRESPAARYQKLQGMMDTTIAGNKIKEAQQQAELQRAQLDAARAQQAQQAFILQQHQREAQQQAEMDRRNRDLAQYSTGVGSGVYSPQMQRGMNTQMQANPQAAVLAQALQQTRDPSIVREMVQAAGGGSQTSAMRDAEVIIASEIQAGKLKPEQVPARRAVLIGAGGREPGSRFDNAGTFVDADTGANARTAVKDRGTGQIGYVDPKGVFQPLDVTKWKPSTLGDTNALLDPPGMEKLRAKVISSENTIRAIGRYLKGYETLEQGASQLADRVSKWSKTFFTKEPLTEQEKAVGLQGGRLNQIIGGLRTAIVGPGVMTEQDAQRIVDALGGDVSALTNPEIVRQLISEILTDKLNEYDSDLGVYNTHVVRKYGGQAGYKQRERVPIQFTAATTPAAQAPAQSNALPSGWRMVP
jgi:hypothetical protein